MKSLFLFCSVAVSLLKQGDASNASNKTQKLAPTELVEIGGETYFFDGIKLGHWENGNLRCQELNMRLVTFENEDKWNSFVQFITENPAFDTWWWTGGRRTLDTIDFFWSGSNNAFNFTAWNTGEPNSNPSRDACVSFFVNWGGWDDDGLNEYYFGYICENTPA